MPDQSISRVSDDERDFYGREYFYSHQERDLGLPNIELRAVQDLPERALFWLRTLLKYKTPPGKIIELRSAHGGFVALLRWAGFDAVGLELSPTIAEFARSTFGVPMLVGRIEEQDLAKASLDVIALMDVLEHLPDPRATMSHCVELLKPDGVLLIQTPRYQEGRTYEAMLADQDAFLEMLKPNEHLFLFSGRSVQQLFLRLDAPYVRFEPAIFSQYDQFLVVSRVELSPHGDPAPLVDSPAQRMVHALLDLDSRAKGVEHRLVEAEADRAARLKVIEEQRPTLSNPRLVTLDAERKDLAAQLADLRRHFDESEADRAARLKTISGLEESIAQAAHEAEAKTAFIVHLEGLLGDFKNRLWAVRKSLPFRLLRKLGWQEPRAEPGLQAWTSVASSRADRGDTRELKRIAIDLTPVLPGGENGGAKLVATQLVENLARLAPEIDFELLTSEKSHQELAWLDSPKCASRSYPSFGPCRRIRPIAFAAPWLAFCGGDSQQVTGIGFDEAALVNDH